MKTRSLIMFQFILALFGCQRLPGDNVESQIIGPFTIEKITVHGHSYNMNYVRVKSTTVSYNVKFKNAPLTFEGGLEYNTALPGIWRVFEVKGPAQPTLLLGSQSLYLVTLENDKPAIKPVYRQGSDFASIQWLDSENGQPGTYREVYSSDTYDTDNALSGGRYLLVSHAVVLDIRTLDVIPFDTTNYDVDGYSRFQHRAVAFAPDSTQIVFIGYRQDEEDYMKNHFALLCYDFRKKSAYAVPFEKEKTNLFKEDRIMSPWVEQYFEWVPQSDGSQRLAQRSEPVPSYHPGIIFNERFKGYTYILDPVEEPMMEAMVGFVKEQLKPEASQETRTTEQYHNKYTIAYPGHTVVLEYGEYGNDLVLKMEGDSLSEGEMRKTIDLLGKGFDMILATGQYSEYWIDWTQLPPEE